MDAGLRVGARDRARLVTGIRLGHSEPGDPLNRRDGRVPEHVRGERGPLGPQPVVLGPGEDPVVGSIADR